jgi:hypothetical protein
MPEGVERADLIHRRDELKSVLWRSDKAMVAARVTRMFLRFPSSRGADPEATVAAYATDLCRFPLWAVDRGLAAIISGKSGAGSFVPSSVECQAACERELAPFRNELADLTAILDAAVYREAPDYERARVIREFDALVKELKLRDPHDPARRNPNQMTREEAQARLEAQLMDPKPTPAMSHRLREQLGLMGDVVPSIENFEQHSAT